jgi:hypothetical protein
MAPGAPEKQRRRLLLEELLASLEKLRDESSRALPNYLKIKGDDAK